MEVNFDIDEFSDITTGHEKPEVNHNLIDQTNKHISELYNKYGHDLYMTSKIYHYVSQQLPSLLVNVYESRQKSAHRMETHLVEQEKFITDFLHGSHSNKYYYHSTNDMYYEYDGLHYSECRQDDVLYNIVSSITKTHNNTVQNWKHKTKVSVLRKIKDNALTKSIPESTTIQNVLGLFYPSVFSRKSETKYFLSIIGDNIQKKRLDLIHFIHPCANTFLREFQDLCFLMLHTNCTQTFKLKCHEKHELDLSLCRLVPILRSAKSEYTWKQQLKENIIDILCVACHYSNRYGSSEHYLQDISEHETTKYALYIKNNSMEQIFQNFIQEYLLVFNGKSEDEIRRLIPECSPQDDFFQSTIQSWKQDNMNNTHISCKHIFYLWKDFLRVHIYPQNLFYGQIKQYIVQRFQSNYELTTDCFTGITSSHLPTIQKFLKFWDETMYEDENETVLLEMDEIAQLFRKWITKNGSMKTKREKYLLDETKMIDILNYYKPNVIVQDNKYIWNIKCILWDKEAEIQEAMQALQQKYMGDTYTCSLHDAYLFYSQYNSENSTNKHSLIVNKLYFVTIVKQIYNSVIDEYDVITQTFFQEKKE